MGGAFLLGSIAFLLLGLAFAPFAPYIKAVVGVFTEGTTMGKSFFFLFYLFLLLLFSRILDGFRPLKKYLQKSRTDLQKAVLILIFGGFAFSLILQLNFQSYYGLGNGDYAAHVTDCGDSVCWEATYLQHSHIPKTALFYLEKTTGLNAGNLIDDGRPMFEITPFAPIFAPLMLLLLLFLGFFGVMLASSEKSGFRLAFLFLAVVLSMIAILDGGIFTQTGVNAVVAFLLYSLFNNRCAGTAVFFVPLAAGLIAIILSNFGYWFLGTQLYFRDWYVIPLFLVSCYAIIQKKFKPRILFFAIFAFSVILFYLSASSALSGSSASGQQSILVYGLPILAPERDVASVLGLPANDATKYGWYAKIIPVSPLNTRQVESRLRAAFSPKGYLFAEIDQGVIAERQVEIIWLSGRIADDEIATASFTPSVIVAKKDRTILKGKSSLSGPHLALEVGSYLHSLGIDAIVVGKVI